MARSLSKKQRFDVFKRDCFVCQYCGAHPPAAVLEVDHITAVANGGTDDIDNLITSCFDCNRGKGAVDLAVAPQTVVEKAGILKEKEEQLAAYNRLLASVRRRQTRLIGEIEAVFTDEFGMVFTDRFKASIRGNFTPKLSKDQLLMAIHKACQKCAQPESATKYFCGVCWRLIKGDSY